jgi:aspartate 1-decarboxylase
MQLQILKSKIHRAAVTGADLDYVGSITLDAALMRAAGILPHERVLIVNNNNGARFETYVIEGRAGSGAVFLNGAAARLALPGDIIIILSFALMDAAEAEGFVPKVVFVDEKNRVTRIGVEQPEC